MAYELYQRLELSTNATPEEIKKSYFRLVRKYSSEKDPERFQQIREAYNTLYDPQAREEYDSLQKHGELISQLSSEAEEKMTEQEFDEAIILLKKILIILPNADSARNQLGLCYAHQQNWDKAISVYQKLTKTKADTSLYWRNYGSVLQSYADSLEEENTLKQSLYEQAREKYKKVIDLQPFNSEPYVKIAETYVDQKEYERALSWAERALSADGKIDIQDLDTFLYICRIHSYSNQIEKIELVTEKIANVLSEMSEDAYKYVAAQFYNIGLELYKLGLAQSSIYILKVASSFFKAAKKFDPEDEDTKQIKGQLDNLIQAYEQYDSFSEDSRISSGFSILASFYLARALNQEIEDSDKVFEGIISNIFSSNSQAILSSIRTIKLYYSSIYNLNDSLFDEIEKTAQKQLEEETQKKSKPPEKNVFDKLWRFFS